MLQRMGAGRAAAASVCVAWVIFGLSKGVIFDDDVYILPRQHAACVESAIYEVAPRINSVLCVECKEFVKLNW